MTLTWGRFALALLATLVVQTVVAWLLGARYLDAFLLLSVLAGLLAPARDARLMALAAGLAQDLTSADVLGLHAFSLGLTGLLLTLLLEVVNTSVLWARIAVCFLAALPGQLLCAVHTVYWSGHGLTPWPLVLADVTILSLVAAIAASAITSSRRFSRRRVRRA